MEVLCIESSSQMSITKLNSVWVHDKAATSGVEFSTSRPDKGCSEQDGNIARGEA